MKHRVISLILVLVLAAGLTVLPVRAGGVEGDWKYETITGGVRLTGYLGSETELTLPASLGGLPVLEIGDGCFRESDLTEVTIPHGIRVIGEEAFYKCASLKKANLGGSVNVICARAFAFSGLIKMDIPGCVRTIDAEAFAGCTSLYNIVIEEGVEDWDMDIGTGFGSGSVTMEEGLEYIGEQAFFDCVNLTKMSIPKSVKEIGTKAIGFTYEGRQGSYEITGYPGTAAESYANDYALKFKPLEAGDGMSGVCGADVTWSWSEGTLTVEGTGRMYDYSAAECLPWYGLRSETTAAVVGEGVTSLGDYAFSGSAVESVVLPGTLAWVGAEAFGGCNGLKELTFTGNAPDFAADAFADTTLTAWYPGENDTWTEAVRQNYGGSITWRKTGGLPFVDVPEDSFCYDAVAWALEQGITTGTDGTHFSPNEVCHRAAVVTFLWRAAGSPEPQTAQNPFVDVKSTDFYYKAVLWAVEEGITNGLDATHFGPGGNCNRAQVVAFLYRAVGSPQTGGAENPFQDVPSDQWFAPAVLWAVREGITNGLDATHFGPGSTCSRAQIVTFLYRAMAD